MSDETNKLPVDVFYNTLKALNIDIGEFTTNILNEKPKEVLIFAKIHSLYFYHNDN